MTDELRVRQATASRSGVMEPGSTLGHRARFLIAEHNAIAAEKLMRDLGEDGQAVSWERSIDAAFARSQCEEFDVLIVNLRLGEEDGLRLCSQFRSQEQTRHTPILLVIDESDLSRLSLGMELGVTDYLVKPFDPNELRARCRTQVRRRCYHEQLKSLLHNSVSMAYSDTLTGLYNRRYLIAHLNHKITELSETDKPLSILMIDIDHFKSVNDTFGHAFGDEVLRGVAQGISGGLRDSDTVARYGGEEFVVVMPDTTAGEALTVAERLRMEVAGLAFPVPGKDDELSMTVSIGAATSCDSFESVESLMERADQALYGAKRAGRNATVAAEPDRGQRLRAVAN